MQVGYFASSIRQDVLLDLMLSMFPGDVSVVEGVVSNPFLSAGTVRKHWYAFRPAGVAKTVIENCRDPLIVDVFLDNGESRVSVLETLLSKWRLSTSQAARMVGFWPLSRLDRCVSLLGSYPAQALVSRVSEMGVDAQLDWVLQGGFNHVGEDRVWDILWGVASQGWYGIDTMSKLQQVLLLFPQLRSRVVAEDNLMLWESVVYAPFSADELSRWVTKIVERLGGLVGESFQCSTQPVCRVAVGVLGRPDLDEVTHGLLRDALEALEAVPVRELGFRYSSRPIQGETLAECSNPDRVLAYLHVLRNSFPVSLDLPVVLYLLESLSTNPVVWSDVEIRRFFQQETCWYRSLTTPLITIPEHLVPMLEELAEMCWTKHFERQQQYLCDLLNTATTAAITAVGESWVKPEPHEPWPVVKQFDNLNPKVGSLEPKAVYDSLTSRFELAPSTAHVVVWLEHCLGDGGTLESKQKWETVFRLFPEWDRTYGELVDVANRIG